MSQLQKLLERTDTLLDRLQSLLPAEAGEPDWTASVAWIWKNSGHGNILRPIAAPHRIRLADIRCVERQKQEIDRNTRQFLHGYPANNVLLWGSRGTGKSSLIKALLNEYAARGLRLVQVSREQLTDLTDILDVLAARNEKFLLYCDDLSFTAEDSGYKALKAALDGSVYSLPDNVLIYATSNRRHLLPEFNRENTESQVIDGEIHFAEAVEEKISLSDRFGLWLSFHAFTQDQYLEVVRYWLTQLGAPLEPWEQIRGEALKWALNRGSRSGRTAWHFCRDRSGRLKIAPD